MHVPSHNAGHSDSYKACGVVQVVRMVAAVTVGCRHQYLTRVAVVTRDEGGHLRKLLLFL